MSKCTLFDVSSDTHRIKEERPEPDSPISKIIRAFLDFRNLAHLALISSLPINRLDWPISKGLALKGFSLSAGMPRIGDSSLINSMGFTGYMMFQSDGQR